MQILMSEADVKHTMCLIWSMVGILSEDHYLDLHVQLIWLSGIRGEEKSRNFNECLDRA